MRKIEAKNIKYNLLSLGTALIACALFWMTGIAMLDHKCPHKVLFFRKREDLRGHTTQCFKSETLVK